MRSSWGSESVDGATADSGIDATDHLCERYWAGTVNPSFGLLSGRVLMTDPFGRDPRDRRSTRRPLPGPPRRPRLFLEVLVTLEARLTDLRHVVDYFDLDSYALFGSSFGGTVALHTAAVDDRVTAVATRAPVTTAGTFDEPRAAVERDGEWTFDTGERLDHRFFESLDRHPFDDVVGSLSAPVAIFHGGDDAVVDPADSFDAAKRLETDVSLERFAGEGHRFSRAGERRLLERLFDWLEWVERRH